MGYIIEERKGLKLERELADIVIAASDEYSTHVIIRLATDEELHIAISPDYKEQPAIGFALRPRERVPCDKEP